MTWPHCEGSIPMTSPLIEKTYPSNSFPHYLNVSNLENPLE